MNNINLITKKIFIGSDHRGFEDKKLILSFLSTLDIETVDLGPEKYNQSDDYTDSAIKVAQAVQQNKNFKGILLCGSGVGMTIAANKFDDIRASEVRSRKEAIEDRKHHDSNILVLPADHLDIETIKEILPVWLSTKFEGGRHERRIKEINIIEDSEISQGLHPIVVPAILSSSLADYVNQFIINKAFTNQINIDISYGEYVDLKTPDIFEIINNVELDAVNLSVHLMVKDPKEILTKLEKIPQVYIVYVHYGTLDEEFITKERPYELGLTFNPDENILDHIDLIKKVRVLQLMTVVPGGQGKELRIDNLPRILELKKSGFDGEIHLDGGINEDSILNIIKYDIDVLNIGSGISRNEDPKQAFLELNNIIRKHNENK